MFKTNAVLRLGCLAFLLSITSVSWGASQMFQPAQLYLSGGDNARSIAVADLNGDGKLDLIVTSQCDDGDNCQTGLVGELFGNGDGTFQKVHTYNSGGLGANSVALGDVNGDGKPDLLVANGCGGYENCPNGKGGVGVLLGNGDGTFQTAQSYSSGDYSAGFIVLGDVNGDGKPDLLVANSCGGDPNCQGRGSVGVLLGNGDGTFQTAHIYDSGGYGPRSLAVADVNRDGKLDLLVTDMCIDHLSCQNGSMAGVLLGNGDGTFQSVQTYYSGGSEATSIAVDDVNGDGRLDLLVSHWCATVKADCTNDPGVVGVLLGNGDGTFRKAQRIASGGLTALFVTVADVNGDGKPDLLTSNECHSYNDCRYSVVGVLLGNGDGTFQKAQVYSSGFYHAAFIAVADVNGDGKPDLLAAHNNPGGSVGVLLARHATATALSSNLNPSVYGQAVTLTATVSSDAPSAPVGTVTFRDGTKWLGKATLSGGVAVLTTNRLTVGTHSITARYNGAPDFVKSTSAAVIQVVNAASTTTTIKSSVNPSAAGQPVTFTANVTSPTARVTETVTFTAGTTTLGSVSLSRAGKASVTTSALPSGSNTVTATYGGTDNIIGSTASLTQIVN